MTKVVAAVMPAPHQPVELREFDDPHLEPGGILLRTEYSEVRGTNAGPSSVNAHEHINRKHVEIRGCWGSEAGHFLRALTVLEMQAQAIPFRDIGARTYGLAELNQALEDAAAMRLPKALVAPHMRQM